MIDYNIKLFYYCCSTYVRLYVNFNCISTSFSFVSTPTALNNFARIEHRVSSDVCCGAQRTSYGVRETSRQVVKPPVAGGSWLASLLSFILSVSASYVEVHFRDLCFVLRTDTRQADRQTNT